MQKITKYLLCSLTVLVLIINSCKKDNLRQGTGAVTFASSQISAREITAWFSALPQASELQPQWSNVTKSTTNGQDVVQLPIGTDAALFFTKNNGVLNVSAYKWLDKQPGAAVFTGNIVVYSFNTNSLSARVYNKGVLTKSAVYNPANLPQPSVSPTTTPVTSYYNKGRNFDSNGGSLFGALICWLTGGTWTAYQTNQCDYTNSIWDQIVSILDNIFGGGGGGDGGSSNGDSRWHW